MINRRTDGIKDDIKDVEDFDEDINYTELEDDLLYDDNDAFVRASDYRENAIEWYLGEKTMTVTLTQRKLINKLMRYADRYPEEVQIKKVNEDGTVLMHVPLSYLKLSRPRAVTEEQRQRMRDQAHKNMSEGKGFANKKSD